MEFDKTLTSGSTKLLLMKLLEQQDMYGYQMIEELRRRSDHTFDLRSGTLYPLLHALEQEGWVTAREEPAAGGRTRRYYHLTGSGREALGKKEAEWRSYAAAVTKVLEGGAHCVGAV